LQSYIINLKSNCSTLSVSSALLSLLLRWRIGSIRSIRFI